MTDKPDEKPFEEMLQDAKDSITEALPTVGAGFLALRSRCGFDSATCPGEGDNLSTVGLVDLAYTFEVCKCPLVPYDHLAEQLWHRTCLGQHEAPPVAG